jgi:hypothetical protein
MAKNIITNSDERNPNIHDIEFFLKFGKQEHIERLYRHGEIYMKPMEYYRSCGNMEIKDPLEGISEVEHCNHVQFFELNETGDGPGKKIAELSGKGFGYPTEKIEGYLYCLYALRKEDFQMIERQGLDSITIDPQFDHYDYVAFIKADEFIKRFEKAFQGSGIDVQHDLVKYIDFYTHTGPLNQFNKYVKHSDQKEYRFFFPSRDQEAVCFSIGSLEDICKIGLRKSNQQVRFAKKV